MPLPVHVLFNTTWESSFILSPVLAGLKHHEVLASPGAYVYQLIFLEYFLFVNCLHYFQEQAFQSG